MSETVYLVGAGLNRDLTLRHWLGFQAQQPSTGPPPQWQHYWKDEKPPLANDFFQLALRSIICEKFVVGSEQYSDTSKPVLDYIGSTFGRSKDSLLEQPFNLEDCFTMLQLQADEAERDRDEVRYKELMSITSELQRFLFMYLCQFPRGEVNSKTLAEFAQLVYSEKPNIITFNYDCILENLIEMASSYRVNASGFPVKPPHLIRGSGKFLDEDLSYSEYNWNRALAYGVKFDEVASPWPFGPDSVDGSRFYGHSENELYRWKILKLHGSLNWFYYLPIGQIPFVYKELPAEKKETVVFDGNSYQGAYEKLPYHQGWAVQRLVITPVLYKERYLQHKFFQRIWTKARESLSTCKKLVVVGYSFAPTDFHVKKLLLEAFSMNSLEELVVVDPDSSTIAVAKELTRFNRPVIHCCSLREFLDGKVHGTVPPLSPLLHNLITFRTYHMIPPA